MRALVPPRSAGSSGLRSAVACRRLALAAALIAFSCGGSSSSSASASGTCETGAPCPLPLAMVVRVFPLGAPAPIPGAFVIVRMQSGTVVLGTFPCAAEGDESVCQIGAQAGLYDLEVGAPGFATAEARAEVTAQAGGCCPTVNRVTLDVPLTRS